jgi:dipeptidyl aminopeptidase/acylaminoacyl peptidase
VNRLFYKLNGVGLFAGKRVHLFKVKERKEPVQITKGEFDIEGACWSPDGESIAVITNLEKDADMTHARRIYTMNSGGGELRRVTSQKHSIDAISWSPNGEEIAYLGDDFHARGTTNKDIWIIPSEGGESVNVTENFDRSLSRGIGSDLRVSSQNPSPVWAPGCRILYFLTGTVPYSNVYRVDKETRVVEQVTEGLSVDSFSFSDDFNIMAFNAMTSVEPCELYIQEGKVSRKATDFNEKLISEIQVTKPEKYTWKNVYGEKIEGWIIKPPDFNPNKKYPTILQIHGGPLGIFGEGIYHEFQILASSGYCVIYTNPRGSGGYNEEYAATLNGRHGTVDYKDIMDFTEDALSRYAYIDEEKMGVTGGSYGGYLTNWIITQAGLFKAAVSCRSTCNRHSHHGYSDYGYKHGESGNMGYPWRDEQKLLAQSPITYASSIKTPTLLIHSENDLRCTIEQAEEFFTALMELGVPTELVRFPDENHELSRSGKPRHREERLHHILRWFDKYLK